MNSRVWKVLEVNNGYYKLKKAKSDPNAPEVAYVLFDDSHLMEKKVFVLRLFESFDYAIILIVGFTIVDQVTSTAQRVATSVLHTL